MNRYFYVPVTAKAVMIEGISLFDLLEAYDKEMSSRENKRIQMKYELESFDEDFIASFNQETLRISKNKKIPSHIIVVKNESGIKELCTEKPVTSSFESFLEVFEIGPESIIDLFTEYPDYSDDVSRFIHTGIEKNKKFVKKKSNNKKPFI